MTGAVSGSNVKLRVRWCSVGLLLVAACTDASHRIGSDDSSGATGPDVAEARVTVPTSAAPETTVSSLGPAPAAPLTAATVAPDGAPMPDLVALSSTGGAVVVRDGIAAAPVRGIVAPDRRTLITTSSTAGLTTISWMRLTDGSTTASVTVNGELDALVTNGRVVGLRTRPASEGTTDLVVVSPSAEVFRGSYSAELLPEGFASSSTEEGFPTGMFVVEYLDPAPADPEVPRAYRVRVLDLISGELGLPFNLRDKAQVVDEEMLGFSRTHVLSSRDGLLFTLYRGIGADDYNDAFVHTLGFFNGVWCLDLPDELELERLSGAVTLADSETRLLVASANGAISEFVVGDIVNPDRDPVTRRTVQSWQPTSAEGPALASAPDPASTHRVVVGQGDTLHWLDENTLSAVAGVVVDRQITAVAMVPGGDAIAAGDGWLSRVSATGSVAASVAVPDGLGPIGELVVFGGS